MGGIVFTQRLESAIGRNFRDEPKLSPRHVRATYYIGAGDSHTQMEAAKRVAIEQSAKRGRGAAKVVAVEKIGPLVESIRGPRQYEYRGDKWRDSTAHALLAKVDYPIENFGNDLSMCWLSLAGETNHMASLWEVRLLDVEFPREYASQFKGPNFGRDWFWEFFGAKRPLLVGPVKPSVKGSTTIEQFARKAYLAARGGVDIIKMDELYHLSHGELERIISATKAGLKRAEDETGERKLFVVTINSGDFSEFARNYELASRNDCAVLVSPYHGFSHLGYAAKQGDVQIFAHNEAITNATSSGRTGHSFSVVMKFFRLNGADVMIMPAPLGSFLCTRGELNANRDACWSELGNSKTSSIAVAGGQTDKTLKLQFEMLGDYRFMFIVGAFLYDKPQIIESRARALRVACGELE